MNSDTWSSTDWTNYSELCIWRKIGQVSINKSYINVWIDIEKRDCIGHRSMHWQRLNKTIKLNIEAYMDRYRTKFTKEITKAHMDKDSLKWIKWIIEAASLEKERECTYIERPTKAYLERDKIQWYVETDIDRQRGRFYMTKSHA
jgi:hypothetical protein